LIGRSFLPPSLSLMYLDYSIHNQVSQVI
jgi:hypothetical protein